MRRDLICIFLAIVESMDCINPDSDDSSKFDINCFEEDCAIWDVERECCSFNTKRRIINLRRD